MVHKSKERHGHGSIQPKKLLEFLERLDYPASKEKIVGFAEKKGDDYIEQIIREIPGDIEYNDAAHVLRLINIIH